jgi:hypothetical protein
MGFLSSIKNMFFGSSPSASANRYLDQIPDQMSPYYQPYMDAGKESLGTLKGQYGDLINDPGQKYADLGKGYKQSPGYQYKLQQALGAQANAQARGGMLGTQQDQTYAAQTANDIASQDFNDYMDKVTGLYGEGIKGEQGLEEQGYDANTSFGNMVGSIYGQKGRNAYDERQAENAQRAKMWSDVFKTIGGMGMPGA